LKCEKFTDDGRQVMAIVHMEDHPMTIAGHRLTLDPMGNCSNAFFSEITNMIKAKLYMNVHWMVLYKLYVFCSVMKFKMAATAGLSLTLDPTSRLLTVTP
jgi:hypothetical protein